MKVLKLCAALFLLFLTGAGLSCASVEVVSDPEIALVNEVSDSEIEPSEELPVLMPELRMPEVGEDAPMFEILTVDGKAYNLKAETKGKVVSIVFWSMYCAPCRRSMPILDSLHKEYDEKDFELIAISMDGEKMLEGVQTYVSEEAFEFVVLMDEYDGETMKVSDPYGIQGTPTIYLIGRDGKIAFSKVGDVEEEEFRALVSRELEKPRTGEKAGE
jgi:thiol-disulfide isomerase/thioredoxin